MTNAPEPAAPLRNRIRVELDAPVSAVWSLLGDLARFPEYSAGLERVDAKADANGHCAEYVCHFKPRAEGQPGIVDRNLVAWYEPQQGYASHGAPGSAFGLRNDLHIVTVESSARGTLVTFSEHFDSADLDASRAEYAMALADAAERLIMRFGGRVVERYADATHKL